MGAPAPLEQCVAEATPHLARLLADRRERLAKNATGSEAAVDASAASDPATSPVPGGADGATSSRRRPAA